VTDPTKIDIEFDPTQERMSGIARHGNTPFDVISEIVPGLWQGGCRTGLKLPGHIEHVISLYPWESYQGHDDVRSALSVVMYDSEDQGYAQVDAIAAWVNVCRADGPTLVHCQAGLNRSSLVAARALMLDGFTAQDAIALLREKRSPACLCNRSFESYLLSLDPVPATERRSQ
jgi:Dual specificity phosphatase, catalytic domain